MCYREFNWPFRAAKWVEKSEGVFVDIIKKKNTTITDGGHHRAPDPAAWCQLGFAVPHQGKPGPDGGYLLRTVRGGQAGVYPGGRISHTHFFRTFFPPFFLHFSITIPFRRGGPHSVRSVSYSSPAVPMRPQPPNAGGCLASPPSTISWMRDTSAFLCHGCFLRRPRSVPFEAKSGVVFPVAGELVLVRVDHRTQMFSLS